MAELQGLQLKTTDLKQHDTDVVAVVVDPVERNALVIRELKLSFPILADSDRRVIRTYDLLHPEGGEGGIARPATFVIDRDGIVRWRNLTASFRLRPSPEEVVAAVAALGTR
ncbi:MAG: redoxin domain-containing protein [Deltaproteobacteria bacterium]|nr:redoxin domain-containing protein [Deltaproteobacteria bacterium]